MPKFKVLLIPILAASLSLIIPISASAESPEINVIISEEVGAWGLTPAQKRTGQQEAFILADQLDSSWNLSLENLKEEGTSTSVQTSLITAGSPNTFSFTDLNSENVTVTADNVDLKDLNNQEDLGTKSSAAYQYKAKLDLPGVGANTYNGDTMQDFAPVPTRFAGQNYANESQNGFGDQNNFRNGLLFSFSKPLQAFGVWLGDLETRTDGFGTPAILRLFDTQDNFIHEEIVPPNNWVTQGDQNQSACSTANTTTDLINKTGCGHNTTRFIGFSSAFSLVKRMLIIVGDDDNFPDQPEDNSGNTEHISFIGPTAAFFLPTQPQEEEYEEVEEPVYTPPTKGSQGLILTNSTNSASTSLSSVNSTKPTSKTNNHLASTGQSSILLISLSLILFVSSALLFTKQSRRSL